MSLDIRMTEFCRTPDATWPNMPLNTAPALGIELEYEGCNGDYAGNFDYWSIVHDGSLRNSGVELVSRPVLFDEVDAAVTEAVQVIRQIDGVSTERCGAHVHVNMRPYTVGQTWGYAAMYALLEPTIFATFALGREDSIFGVPLWDNHPQINALYLDICALRAFREEARRPYSSVVATCKYGALNFSSLAMFGTLEMRQPYCTNDPERLLGWIDFVKRLHTRSVGFDDPLDILSMYEVVGLGELQRQLFGESIPINEELQEKAEDAAYFIAGYEEPSWESLEWTLEETA